MTKLHMIGLPHTKVSNEYSHCAFTGKIFRFPKMMQPLGYRVIEYSPEGSESEAKTKVPVLSNEEFITLTKLYQEELPGTVARMDSTLFKIYNEKLVEKMRPHVKKHDIICHPFGFATKHLFGAFPEAYHVETGIGYNDSWAPFRIFESYSWWHYHQGKERRYGHNYEFVIPNYYDVSEWTVQPEQGKYLLYFGRIQADKGLDVVKEIAKQTGMKTIICGKGDPTPYLDKAIPNLIYEPPISGLARDALLGNAYAMLMPTIYTEPFGGAGVEGMLCGTPLIASDHGAFSETVTDPRLRCKTLKDWLKAIKIVENCNRQAIALKARAKYNLGTVSDMYDTAFKQILELQDKGWYTL
jgi:glycosyltransferase involved in cell wall biosynthesis